MTTITARNLRLGDILHFNGGRALIHKATERDGHIYLAPAWLQRPSNPKHDRLPTMLEPGATVEITRQQSTLSPEVAERIAAVSQRLGLDYFCCTGCQDRITKALDAEDDARGE